MKKVAVTGATGMIGRQIVQLLQARDLEVRALVRRGKTLPHGVRPVIGDLDSPEALRALLSGVDTVCHCAAELRDIRLMHAVNVQGTEKLAKLAAALEVECFVHLSSAGVVGPSSELWIDEKTPCKPVGPYEVSKLEAEATLAGLPLKQMRLCMLRPTNVIDEEHPGVLGLVLRHSWPDRLALFLKGNEGAHLIHAEDVAAAALHLAEVESCSGRFFVACDEDPLNTVAEAARTCGQVTGLRKSPSCSLPPGAPYFLRLLTKGKRLHGRSRFSSARIKATGFEFKVGLEQAINRVCRSYARG